MGVGLALYAAGFNALLWLGHAGLSPVVARARGAPAGWAVALIGPLALLALAARLHLARRDVLVAVAAASLAAAGLLAN
jgi:hypothetical protein